MKLLVFLLLAWLVFGFPAAPVRAAGGVDKNLTKQISEILAECKKVTAGTTRAELLKVFATDGGLSNAKRHIFVHRRCPYSKVDIEFALSSPEQGMTDEKPTDKVVKISKAYLEWSIDD